MHSDWAWPLPVKKQFNQLEEGADIHRGMTGYVVSLLGAIL